MNTQNSIWLEGKEYKLVSVDALARWRSAFAEELAAWDIDPPLHHVQASHEEIEAVLKGWL